MLTYILYGLFVLACIILIVVILLQPGKADAGALFSNTLSSTAFGPRGTQTILAKITVGAAATFFIVALLLGFGVGGGQHSLMEGGVTTQPTATPAPAASPAEGAAPAGTPAAAPAEGAGAATTPAASPTAAPAATASPAATKK